MGDELIKRILKPIQTYKCLKLSKILLKLASNKRWADIPNRIVKYKKELQKLKIMVP